ncbi:DNA polymerase I [Plectonema phage Pbo-yong3]|uniref:DNA polymerase I n=1 Tax=Plectonema phage Pbo-yong3 TaxID=2970324 RepID=UPI00403D056F|nr:DNA polymerase I [Plectonema phage Pbo-yong3]
MPTYIALDLETEQIAKMPKGKIHALFFGYEGGGTEWYPWGLAAASVIDQLLANPDVIFVIQNAAFDVMVLRHHGVDIPSGRYVDTKIAAHCINPQLGDYSLEGYGRSIDDEKIDYKAAMVRAGLWDGDPEDPAIYDLPLNDIMVSYGCQDAALTIKWWLLDCLPHLDADTRLRESYYNIHLPAVETTISLSNGLYIDRKRTLKTATELLGDIEEGYLEFSRRYPKVVKLRWDAEKREYEPKLQANGKPVMDTPNLNSPNDMVSLLLMNGWTPTEFKRNTGKPITSQDVLKLLIAEEDTPPRLRECAEFVQNLRSLIGIQNQLMQLLELVGEDGMVRGSWNQTGTQTFRYSSSSPNMQNFSTRHRKWGKRVRACFTPPPGYVMFMGDLSQIELAIVAWYLEVLTGDSAMADGNRRGDDAHDTNTTNWYGVQKGTDEFKQSRPRAKNGIFAASYGAKYRRLALTIGCSFQEARDILETVERSTQITPLKQAVWDIMRQPRNVHPVRIPYSHRKTTTGFLYDCLNTRLFYPGITSTDRFTRESSERKAFNALAQGGCASILRLLCNRSLPYVQKGEGWFAGLIHDEAIGYVKEEYAEETLAHLNREWNSLVLPSEQGGVYVRADFKLVESWSEK